MIKWRSISHFLTCSSACRSRPRWRIGWIGGRRGVWCWGGRQALLKLGKLFEQQKVKKTYWAVVVGVPPEEAGVIDRPILKSGQGSLWKLSLDPAGQEAVTEYRLLKTDGTLSLLEMSPRTGRTHQLRLHAAYGLGCPVVGDPFYSQSGSWALPGNAGNNAAAQNDPYSAAHYPMMLHARTITIPLQPSKPPVHAEAPLPEYMKAVFERFK